MDYQKWTAGVRSFSEALRELPGEIDVTVEIDLQLPDSEIVAIQEKWPGGLPDALRLLWTNGSARINCPYVWAPPPNELSLLNQIFEHNNYIYGGVRFEAAGKIYPGNFGADPNDDLMRQTVGNEGLALWCNCAVFLYIGNGDCLGLDPNRCPDDPAVVYLVHDDAESGYIAGSFTSFLAAWTKLSFIGPEFWLLDYWHDPDSESIDPAKHMTSELRTLLSPRENVTRA